MPKLLARIISLLLVPCLVADPVLCAASVDFSVTCRAPLIEAFQQQALSVRAGWIGPARWRKITSKIQDLVGRSLIPGRQRVLAGGAGAVYLNEEHGDGGGSDESPGLLDRFEAEILRLAEQFGTNQVLNLQEAYRLGSFLDADFGRRFAGTKLEHSSRDVFQHFIEESLRLMIHKNRALSVVMMGQRQIQRGVIRPETWQEIPYLQGTTIRSADISLLPGSDGIGAFSLHEYAFVDPEMARRDAARVYSYFMRGGPSAGPLLEAASRWAQKAKVNARVYADLFSINRLRQEEIAHSKDHVFASLRWGKRISELKTQDIVSCIVKPGSQLHQFVSEASSPNERLLAMATVGELSAQLHGLIAEMDTRMAHRPSPHDMDLAYSLFLEFMGEQQSRYEGNQTRTFDFHNFMSTLLVSAIFELGITSPEMLSRTFETGTQHPAIAALEFVKRLYRTDFYDDEERARLLENPPSPASSAPSDGQTDLPAGQAGLQSLSADVSNPASGETAIHRLVNDYVLLLQEAMEGTSREAKENVVAHYDSFSKSVEGVLTTLGTGLPPATAETIRSRLAETNETLRGPANEKERASSILALCALLDRELFLPYGPECVIVGNIDGQRALLSGPPLAWKRVRIFGEDLLIILWPYGGWIAYSPHETMLMIDAEMTIQNILLGMRFWSDLGFASSLTKFTYEFIRRNFYEELGHFQDLHRLKEDTERQGDPTQALLDWVVPGSPLEEWIRSGRLERANLKFNLAEITTYLRHFMFADSNRSLREAWYGVVTPQDPLHAPAAEFVRKQMEDSIPGADIEKMRLSAKRIFRRNLRLDPDGGVLPTLSQNGKKISEHPDIKGILAEIVELMGVAISHYPTPPSEGSPPAVDRPGTAPGATTQASNPKGSREERSRYPGLSASGDPSKAASDLKRATRRAVEDPWGGRTLGRREHRRTDNSNPEGERRSPVLSDPAAAEPEGVQMYRLAGGADLVTPLNPDEVAQLRDSEATRVVAGPAGRPYALSIPMHWRRKITSLEDVEKALNINLVAYILERRRLHPDRPVTLLEWGPGKGVAIKQLAERLKRAGLSEAVSLFVFADQYYREWEDMPGPVTFVLDRADRLPSYFKEGEIDLMISYFGVTSLRGDYARHMNGLASRIAADGEVRHGQLFAIQSYLPDLVRYRVKLIEESVKYPVVVLQRADVRGPQPSELPAANARGGLGARPGSQSIDTVLDRSGVDRAAFTRIVYTSSGNDLPFVEQLLAYFPNVVDVEMISLEHRLDPRLGDDLEQRIRELKSRLPEQRRSISIQLRAADFYQTRLEPAAGRTVLIDKRFGFASEYQGNPRYAAAIARNTRPGDLILSFPQKARLPFMHAIGEDVIVPGAVDVYAGYPLVPWFTAFLRSEADEPLGHLTYSAKTFHNGFMKSTPLPISLESARHYIQTYEAQTKTSSLHAPIKISGQIGRPVDGVFVTFADESRVTYTLEQGRLQVELVDDEKTQKWDLSEDAARDLEPPTLINAVSSLLEDQIIDFPTEGLKEVTGIVRVLLSPESRKTTLALVDEARIFRLSSDLAETIAHTAGNQLAYSAQEGSPVTYPFFGEKAHLKIEADDGGSIGTNWDQVPVSVNKNVQNALRQALKTTLFSIVQDPESGRRFAAPLPRQILAGAVDYFEMNQAMNHETARGQIGVVCRLLLEEIPRVRLPGGAAVLRALKAYAFDPAVDDYFVKQREDRESFSQLESTSDPRVAAAIQYLNRYGAWGAKPIAQFDFTDGENRKLPVIQVKGVLFIKKPEKPEALKTLLDASIQGIVPTALDPNSEDHYELYLGPEQFKDIMRLEDLENVLFEVDYSAMDSLTYHRRAFEILEKIHKLGLVHGHAHSSNAFVNIKTGEVYLNDWSLLSAAESKSGILTETLDCVFRGKVLTGMDFSGIHPDHPFLEDAILSGAILKECDLRAGEFSGANWKGAILDENTLFSPGHDPRLPPGAPAGVMPYRFVHADQLSPVEMEAAQNSLEKWIPSADEKVEFPSHLQTLSDALEYRIKGRRDAETERWDAFLRTVRLALSPDGAVVGYVTIDNEIVQFIEVAPGSRWKGIASNLLAGVFQEYLDSHEAREFKIVSPARGVKNILRDLGLPVTASQGDDFTLQGEGHRDIRLDKDIVQGLLNAQRSRELQRLPVAPNASVAPVLLKADEIPGRFPTIGALMNPYRGTSPEWYAAYVISPINRLFGGEFTLWQDLVSLIDRLSRPVDKDALYTAFARIAEDVSWEPDVSTQILARWSAETSDGILDFLYSRIERAVYDTAGNNRQLLKIMRGEPLRFGGFVGVETTQSKRTSTITPELQHAWEQGAETIDRQTDGGGYGPLPVKHRVRKLLQELERQGKIGRLILDVGSGPVPVSSTLFYSGKHVVIGVDIALRKPVYRWPLPSPILLVKGDVQHLDQALRQPEVEDFMAKAHGEEAAAFDFVVLSDILNYVDYRQVLRDVVKLMHSGARLVLVNMAGAGETRRFSDKGIKSNADLVDYVKELGLEIEINKSPALNFEDKWASMHRQILVVRIPAVALAPQGGLAPSLQRPSPERRARWKQELESWIFSHEVRRNPGFGKDSEDPTRTPAVKSQRLQRTSQEWLVLLDKHKGDVHAIAKKIGAHEAAVIRHLERDPVTRDRLWGYIRAKRVEFRERIQSVIKSDQGPGWESDVSELLNAWFMNDLRWYPSLRLLELLALILKGKNFNQQLEALDYSKATLRTARRALRDRIFVGSRRYSKSFQNYFLSGLPEKVPPSPEARHIHLKDLPTGKPFNRRPLHQAMKDLHKFKIRKGNELLVEMILEVFQRDPMALTTMQDTIERLEKCLEAAPTPATTNRLRAILTELARAAARAWSRRTSGDGLVKEFVALAMGISLASWFHPALRIAVASLGLYFAISWIASRLKSALSFPTLILETAA